MAKNTADKLARLTATFENGKIDRSSPLDRAAMRKSLYEAVSACQVFIYEASAKGLNARQGCRTVAPDQVAWPFPVMCFEVAGSDSYLAETKYGAKILCILVNTRDRTFWALTVEENNILVGNEKVTLALTGNRVASFDHSHGHEEICTAATCTAMYAHRLAAICTSLLDVLAEETVWKQPTGGKCISYPKPGNRKKKVRIPKPFVYIVGRKPSGSSSNAGSQEPTEMVWTHQWRVRGHWRARAGIGKDHMGRYNQPGRTWIADHVRGPDDKPLVEKMRIVKPNKAAA